tara:strand:- start:2790 stop:2999 length:210 start_codon:yes stop_codon:yes gene_type:complete
LEINKKKRLNRKDGIMSIHIHDIEEMIRLLKRTLHVLKNFNVLLSMEDVRFLTEDISKFLESIEKSNEN